jgi:hypothetical protein
MSVANVVVALCWLGFTVALFSAHMLAAPPQIFDPQASKLLGRWLYLTYQSNILCFLFFTANLVDGVLLDGLYHQRLLTVCKPPALYSPSSSAHEAACELPQIHCPLRSAPF